MGRADFFKEGDYNAICDRCGFKYKASELRMTWDGLFVCPKDWEPRHPQDFVRGVPDKQSVAIARPEQADIFVDSGMRVYLLVDDNIYLGLEGGGPYTSFRTRLRLE